MLKIIKNPDEQKYNEVTKAVEENNLYCPCMILQNSDTLCMCKAFREQKTSGLCHCGRFMKVEADA